MKYFEFIKSRAMLMLLGGLVVLIVAYSISWIATSIATPIATGPEHTDLLTYLHTLPSCWAIGIYTLLFCVQVTCALPATAFMTIVGTTLFGIIPGTLLAIFSTAVGGALSYRAFQVGIIRIQPFLQLQRITWLTTHLNHHMPLCIIIGRLIPFVPFAAVTALAATSRLSIARFTLMSTIGIIPQLILWGALGHQGLRTYTALSSTWLMQGALAVVLAILLGIGLWCTSFMRNILSKE